MSFFSDMQAALEALRAALGDDVESGEVAAAVQRLADDGVVALIEQATVLVRGGESVRIAGSGVVAARSTRDAGHGGLAQKRGHRSPVSLIQDLTGTTRADAAKQVRLGEALAENVPTLTGDPIDRGTDAVGAAGQPAAAPTSVRARPWHAALGDALMTGRLTSAQHDAIYRGLGAPPLPPAGDTGFDTYEASTISADVTAAWETAAVQLIDEAAMRTVEELGSAARSVRDLLDPVGADRRFEERFRGRTFRTWTDRDGTRRGTFQFEDEGGAWIESIIGTALRPRRGGPRFVDSDERTRADDLVADPRTNDQLAYDLIIDILRAGALADPPRCSEPASRASGSSVRPPLTAMPSGADRLLRSWKTPAPRCPAGSSPSTRAASAPWRSSTTSTATPSTSAARPACTHRSSASPSRSATAAAAGPVAIGRRLTAKPTTSTTGAEIRARPTSTAASCCAASTTCSCTTADGASLATGMAISSFINPTTPHLSRSSHVSPAATPSATSGPHREDSTPPRDGGGKYPFRNSGRSVMLSPTAHWKSS